MNDILKVNLCPPCAEDRHKECIEVLCSCPCPPHNASVEQLLGAALAVLRCCQNGSKLAGLAKEVADEIELALNKKAH